MLRQVATDFAGPSRRASAGPGDLAAQLGPRPPSGRTLTDAVESFVAPPRTKSDAADAGGGAVTCSAKPAGTNPFGAP